MAENMTNPVESSGTAEDGHTYVAIPRDKVQEVLDFMDSLRRDEDEVSGNMIAGGGGMIGGISMNATYKTQPTMERIPSPKIPAGHFDVTLDDPDTLTV